VLEYTRVQREEAMRLAAPNGAERQRPESQDQYCPTVPCGWQESPTSALPGAKFDPSARLPAPRIGDVSRVGLEAPALSAAAAAYAQPPAKPTKGRLVDVVV
jgi:hypothetical protein